LIHVYLYRREVTFLAAISGLAESRVTTIQIQVYGRLPLIAPRPRSPLELARALGESRHGAKFSPSSRRRRVPRVYLCTPHCRYRRCAPSLSAVQFVVSPLVLYAHPIVVLPISRSSFSISLAPTELALIVLLFSRLDVNKNAKCVRVYARRALAREGEEATTSVNDDDPRRRSKFSHRERKDERASERRDERRETRRARTCAARRRVSTRGAFVQFYRGSDETYTIQSTEITYGGTHDKNNFRPRLLERRRSPPMNDRQNG